MHDERLAEREEFDPTDGAYAVTTATFEATVRPGPDRWTLTVELPTIEAAVEGDVGDAVAAGWYETLERRLAEVGGVTRTADVTTPVVRRADDVVVVETAVGTDTDPVEEVLALLTFVEGTWVQGIVPGYDYVESVEALRRSARQRGGA